MNKKNVRKMKKRRARKYLQYRAEQKFCKYIGQPNTDETKKQMVIDGRELMEEIFGISQQCDISIEIEVYVR